MKSLTLCALLWALAVLIMLRGLFSKTKSR